MSQRRPALIIGLILPTLFSLLSCETNDSINDQQSTIRVDGAYLERQVRSARSGAVQSGPTAEAYISNSLWVDPTPKVIKAAIKYPELDRRVTLMSSVPLTLNAIAQDLSLASGLQFRLAPELMQQISQSVNINANNDVTAAAEQQDKEAPSASFQVSIRANWRAQPLRDILDSIGTRANISWRYNKHYIDLYKLRTVTYQVNLPTESIVHQSSMTNESLIASGDNTANVSGSTISTAVSLTTDPWKGLLKKIEVIATPQGTYTADLATYTVTLKDIDQVHEEFAAIVEVINREALKQIVFDVTLMTVTGNHENIVGLNYSSFYQKALNAVGFTSPILANTDTNSLTISHIKGVDHFEGVKVFADALNQIGDASIVDSFQQTTLNNQVSPIMLSRNTPYLRQVSIPVEGVNGIRNGEASLTDLVTGFSLTLRPHMINDAEMMVFITVNRRSAPTKFERVNAGPGLFLERPDIQDDSAYYQIKMQNNSTRVLASNIRQNTTTRTSASIDPNLWWLGGSKTGKSEKRTMLLVITARII